LRNRGRGRRSSVHGAEEAEAAEEEAAEEAEAARQKRLGAEEGFFRLVGVEPARSGVEPSRSGEAEEGISDLL
jgi:hypothetical protein